MNLAKAAAVAAGVVLLGLGMIFIIAGFAPGKQYRLAVGGVMTAVSLALFYYAIRLQPQVLEVKVSWDASGKLAVEELRCPNCGAPLPEPKPGQQFVKCPYCGRTIKLIEEPIW